MGRLIFKGYLDALRKSHSQLPLLDMPCVNIEAFSIEDPSDQTSQNQGFIARLPVQNSYGDNFDGEEIKPLLYTLGHSYDGFGNARINPVSPVFCGKFNVNWLLSNNKIPIPSRILGIFHFYVEKLRGIRRVESFGPGMVISPTYAKSGSFSLYLVTPEFRLHIRPNITKNVLCFISPGFRFHVLGSITKNALCIVSPGFRLHVRPNITKNALCLVSEKFTLQLVCVPK